MDYTKGEWKVERLPITKGVVVRANKELIAAGLDEANAHLIASAPDMYEALKEIESWMPKPLAPQNTAMRIQQDKVFKALAKAEGKG